MRALWSIMMKLKIYSKIIFFQFFFNFFTFFMFNIGANKNYMFVVCVCVLVFLLAMLLREGICAGCGALLIDSVETPPTVAPAVRCGYGRRNCMQLLLLSLLPLRQVKLIYMQIYETICA